MRNIRQRHRIHVERRRSHPLRPAGHLTVGQVARRLGAAQRWVYARLHNGRIRAARDPETGLYLIPDGPETSEQLRKLRAGEVEAVRL